jgi:hypothetical protein
LSLAIHIDNKVSKKNKFNFDNLGSEIFLWAIEWLLGNENKLTITQVVAVIKAWYIILLYYIIILYYYIILLYYIIILYSIIL